MILRIMGISPNFVLSALQSEKTLLYLAADFYW